MIRILSIEEIVELEKFLRENGISLPTPFPLIMTASEDYEYEMLHCWFTDLFAELGNIQEKFVESDGCHFQYGNTSIIIVRSTITNPVLTYYRIFHEILHHCKSMLYNKDFPDPDTEGGKKLVTTFLEKFLNFLKEDKG